MVDKAVIKRNVIFYICGVWILSIAGGLITAKTGSELGGLLFVIGPMVMAILLRSVGGDGWSDAGLKLKLKSQWQWYLVAILLYPLTILIVIGLGLICGMTSINGAPTDVIKVLVSGIAVQLIPRMIFATFEEWGWRGYMEPRLSALGIPDFPRYIFVGVIWSLWHFPLILSTPYTTIPLVFFLPLFVVGIIISAVVYGELRKRSRTVWSAVVMHGIANTVAWSVLQSKGVVVHNVIVANYTPEGIMVMVLWATLGWVLIHNRNKIIVPSIRSGNLEL